MSYLKNVSKNESTVVTDYIPVEKYGKTILILS